MTLTQADVDALLAKGSPAARPASPAPAPAGLEYSKVDPEVRRILGLSVPVTVSVASQDMSIKSVLALTVGSIIEFETSFDADLELCVADSPIGQGQAVKIGENFGLRITAIGSVQARIGAMGGL